MRGHEKIIEMRRNRIAPKFVFLNDFQCDTDWFEYREHATVDVSCEQPELLDLRFLIGLRVSVTTTSEDRAKRFMNACKKAGAVAIGVGASEFKGGRWQGFFSEIWHAPIEKLEPAHG